MRIDDVTLPLFIRNSAVCNRNSFNNIGRLISTPSDILIHSQAQARFLTEAEFSVLYNKIPDFWSYTSVKQIVLDTIGY